MTNFAAIQLKTEWPKDAKGLCVTCSWMCWAPAKAQAEADAGKCADPHDARRMCKAAIWPRLRTGVLLPAKNRRVSAEPDLRMKPR